jgi:hypothetical protein
MPSKKAKKSAKRGQARKSKLVSATQANTQSRQSRAVLYAVRIGITPTGKQRTEAEVRAEVTEALDAARKKLPPDENVGAHVEDEGGYLGLGVEWPWLFVTLTPFVGYVAKGFVEGAAKKMGEITGEKLLDLFFKELRDRHLSPGAPKPAPDVTSVVVPEQQSPKKTTLGAKGRKGSRPSRRR